ncbi:MAG: ZIP family metal transporter [Candidatus Fermentibacterota bacterium]
MTQLAEVLVFSWIAGAASFFGGALARLEGSAETVGKQRLVHGVVAFGGGVLVAAVAFALAPVGMANLPPAGLAAAFCLGGVAFCVLDALIARRGGSRAQFMAMLMDFVPEAIALGALFGHDHRAGILLALFIGAQNLPEGFNAYRESVANRVGPRAALITLLSVSLLGPAAGCMGFLFLQDLPVLTAFIMSFAAGGILYLIFQDIAPQSRFARHWTPPLGAVLGFVVGMVGKQVLG